MNFNEPKLGTSSNELNTFNNVKINSDLCGLSINDASQSLNQVKSEMKISSPNRFNDGMRASEPSHSGHHTVKASNDASNAINCGSSQQLSSPKALCAICSDKSSGKHYGVHSCEGCKGFFKRTVRKDLTYACRDEGECVIDKRQRNRCQYCRYQKCLTVGMKREAVQEERQKQKDRNENGSPQPNLIRNESCSNSRGQLIELEETGLTKTEKDFLESLIESEKNYFKKITQITEAKECPENQICESIQNQLKAILLWSQSIKPFADIDIDDQVSLLRSAFMDINCLSLTYRSMPYNESLLLSDGCLFKPEVLQNESLKYILTRLVQDVIFVMRELEIDQTELVLLRCILLFDSEAKNVKNREQINSIRDWICLILSKHCQAKSTDDISTRFANLLMRLPPLRSWSLKGMENKLLIKAANNFDNLIFELLVKKRQTDSG